METPVPDNHDRADNGTAFSRGKQLHFTNGVLFCSLVFACQRLDSIRKPFLELARPVTHQT